MTTIYAESFRHQAESEPIELVWLFPDALDTKDFWMVQTRMSNSFKIAIPMFVFLFAAPVAPRGVVQTKSKLEAAKRLRCTFPLIATGAWTKDGQPDGALKPATLVLQFDSINIDESTAQLRNGTMESEITVRSVPGYLHLMQSFRSGPLYTTTVFDKETPSGKLKAVHSRHEYFATPLPGATSSPEQYYGECEIVN